MINETDALHLRRAFTEIAEEGVPGGVGLWPKVSERLVRNRRVPGLRKAWAAGAVAAVALASIAAVTVGPRMIDELDQLLIDSRGIDAEFGAPIEIDQEQAIGEVTARALAVRVTEMQVVDGVVEDGQLAFEHVIYGLPPRTVIGLDLVDGMPELADANIEGSDTFLPLLGIGTDATSDIFDEQLPEGAVKSVFAFDMHGATVIDDELRLRVEIPLYQYEVDGPPPVVEYDADGNVTSMATQAYKSVEVARFEFEITVPVTVVPGDGKRDVDPVWKVPTPHGEPSQAVAP